MNRVDSLTSCSVIAAATGFAPPRGDVSETLLVETDFDISGGGKFGSSLADCLTSASVIAAETAFEPEFEPAFEPFKRVSAVVRSLREATLVFASAGFCAVVTSTVLTGC